MWGTSEEASTGRSLWLSFPKFLIGFIGTVVGLSLILLAWKLDIDNDLSWWVAILPIIVALVLVFILASVAILLWLNVAVLFFTGRLEVENDEFRLELLFRTAKIVFLGHGFTMLLMLSIGLMLWKLYYWSGLPVVYPLLPLIVLGTAYIFLALVFKQPEVDSPWYLLAGMCLLFQSVALVFKFDYSKESKHLPWATIFIPSWVTYVLLLIYCIISPWRAFREAQLSEDSRSASSCETPYGTEECFPDAASGQKQQVYSQLMKVVGIACWVVGWGVGLVLLTLRLDFAYKVSWVSVFLPALLGWILLLVFVNGPVSEYFTDVASLLLSVFSLAPICSCLKDRTLEKDPLFVYGPRANYR